MASLVNPRYSVKIISGGKTYVLDNALRNCSVSQPKNQIAQKCQVDLANIRINDKYLSEIFTVGCRAYIYYDVGQGLKEKMHGVVWTAKTSESDENVLQLLIYDNGIYLQKSKATWYIGGQTRSVFRKICKKWKLKLSYSYESIKHDKQTIRSKCLSDTFLDFLDEVKKQTGVDYEIYFDGDTLKVTKAGSNSTVYYVREKVNAIKVETETTMDEMVTQIVIQGTAKKNGAPKVIKTVRSNTKQYGVLQDEVTKDKKTTKKKAVKEAKNTLKEKAQPKTTNTITCIDIPMVKRGDLVYVSTQTYEGYLLITDIEHNADKQEMDIEAEKPKNGVKKKSSKKKKKSTKKSFKATIKTT